jgi:hypothetical protein
MSFFTDHPSLVYAISALISIFLFLIYLGFRDDAEYTEEEEHQKHNSNTVTANSAPEDDSEDSA